MYSTSVIERLWTGLRGASSVLSDTFRPTGVLEVAQRVTSSKITSMEPLRELLAVIGLVDPEGDIHTLDGISGERTEGVAGAGKLGERDGPVNDSRWS